jgi:peptidoglycan/xylan/chitin deacetylase (PgdA/CDA1 family)
MRIPGLKSLQQSARWLRSRIGNKALILGYHRIAKFDHDQLGMCVSPPFFSEQMQVLRQFALPISLKDLTQGLSNRNFPDKAVHVTFDDGYADILIHALPSLERNEIPATVYITTGFIGKIFPWDIQEYQMVSVGADDLDSLRALSSEEVKIIGNHDLVEVGAHSVDHLKLRELPINQQLVEVMQSKLKLEEILGRSVTSFSYPHGSYSKITLKIIQSTGFLCACTSVNDVVRNGCDLYKLPRFWAQNWDGDTFYRWLRFWLNG